MPLLNDFSQLSQELRAASPIAWEQGKKDYNIGGNIEIFQLIHHHRFNPAWVEYHHPRLTRVFYTEMLSVPATAQHQYHLEQLKSLMFD